jgi:hypothetical protein
VRLRDRESNRAPSPAPTVAPPPQIRPTTVASPAPVPARSLDAGHGPGGVTPGEPALMGQIRALVKSRPAEAEGLAREARRRFPDGADADERDALLVDALINQEHIGAARDETYYYFDHHPGGRFGDHLSVMTGVRPRPSRPAP